jgi:uncharacterized protein
MIFTMMKRRGLSGARAGERACLQTTPAFFWALRVERHRRQVILAWVILTSIPLVFVLSQWRHHELVLAGARGAIGEIRVLLRVGADVNFISRGNSALTSACGRGRVEAVRILLEHGADPNRRNEGSETPLMKAASVGNLAIVKLLIEYGADTDVKNSCGYSALTLAEQRGRRDVADFLRNPNAGI